MYLLLLHAGNGTKIRFKSSILSRSHPLDESLDESRSEVGKALRDDPTNGFELEEGRLRANRFYFFNNLSNILSYTLKTTDVEWLQLHVQHKCFIQNTEGEIRAWLAHLCDWNSRFSTTMQLRSLPRVSAIESSLSFVLLFSSGDRIWDEKKIRREKDMTKTIFKILYFTLFYCIAHTITLDNKITS